MRNPLTPHFVWHGDPEEIPEDLRQPPELDQAKTAERWRRWQALREEMDVLLAVPRDQQDEEYVRRRWELSGAMNEIRLPPELEVRHETEDP